MGVGGKTFEEYEAMWESDDEEEAFVDSLAMSLMEDEGGGPADIDEDPVEDWGDLYADEDDEKDDPEGSDSESGEDDKKTSKPPKKSADDSDEDAFMEDADSDNDSDIEEDQIIAGLGVDAFGDDDDDAGENVDDDDSADGIFLGESDDSEAE